MSERRPNRLGRAWGDSLVDQNSSTSPPSQVREQTTEPGGDHGFTSFTRRNVVPRLRRATERFKRNRKALGRRLFKLFTWAIFGVLFGLFPVFANAYKGEHSSKGFSLADAFASGELYIVSAIIAANSVGELLNLAAREHKRSPFLVVGVGAACLVCFVLSTFNYMEVSAPSPTVATDSQRLFWWTFAFSALGIWLGADG